MNEHFVNQHRRCAVVLVLTAMFATGAWAQSATPQPPSVLFGELYECVAMSDVFADTKAFADATPKQDPQDILAAYFQEQPRTTAELRQFVERHFEIAAPHEAAFIAQDRRPIGEHIESLWDVLTRLPETPPPHSTLLRLPYPYVVPGGRFTEMYYWDSYFTLLGVSGTTHHPLVESMVKNVAYMIDTYGHMPNGTRTYYLSRSQPPFFFKMVGLLAPQDEARAYTEYLPQLRKEHAFWMNGESSIAAGGAYRRVVKMPDGSVLNRYWDDRDTPRDESFRADKVLAQRAERDANELYRDLRATAESGWDFGSRWFADGRTLATIQTTAIVPIDLNSLLFGLENAIRQGCERNRDRDCVAEFKFRAARRRAAINRYLWDEQSSGYHDYQWRKRQSTGQVSMAIVYPLFFGVADPRQADAVAGTVQQKLLKQYGVVTTPLDTGQQWDAPNGWAPLQWLAVEGLERYGHHGLAKEIAQRWMTVVNATYEQSGKLMEKYDVVNRDRAAGGGEYPLQDGFGWSNGVMRQLIERYASPHHQGHTQAITDAHR